MPLEVILHPVIHGREKAVLSDPVEQSAAPEHLPHRMLKQVAHRVEKGAVTERAVEAAAKAGARLVLGPRAVLTPLAKDKARALGVAIEKER